MELSVDQIRTIGEAYPGSAAIYHVVGTKLKTVYASPDLPGILDMDPEEYRTETATDAMDIILPGDRPAVQAAMLTCIRGEREKAELFYRVIHRHAGFDWVHVQAKIIGTMEGSPVFAASFTNATVETDIYQDIINHMSGMIYVCDCDTYEILYANEAAAKYRQQENRRLFGMPCYTYIKDRKEPCEDCFMKRMREGDNLSMTRFNPMKHTWELLHGEYINWCGHHAFVQYIEDVTASETLHQELTKTEKRLESAVEAAGLNVWEYDLRTHQIICADGSFCKYGLPRLIEQVPQSLLTFVAPEDHEKLLEFYKRIEKDEAPLTEVFHFRKPQTGENYYVRTIYMVMKDQSGTPVSAYGTGVDITSHVLEQENYRNNVQALLTANPDALCSFLLNLSGNQCLEAHGTSSYILETLKSGTMDGVIQNILRIMPDAQERTRFEETFGRTHLLQCYQEGKVSGHMDYRRYGENGEIMWVRSFWNLLRDPETNELNGILYSLDTTQSVKHQREEVEKERLLRKQANAANEAKTEFLSRISHDMRTPLNVILGLTHLSLEREHTPETMDELNKINAVSKFMLGLINDVLDVSRVETGHMTLHPEPYDVEEFQAYLDAFAVPLCEQKELKLIQEVQTINTYVPLVDKLRINQIVFNLMSNAAKFTPEGGTITIRLQDQLTPSGRLALQIMVRDTGIGISEEFQKHLFEPFVQERRDDTSLTRGSGLGLAIAKQIADLMQAKLTVCSEPGKGTCFTLSGEFDCVSAGQLEQKRQEEQVADYDRLLDRHVLLCEDHPMNQEITRTLLEKKGIVVDLAENGESGVEKFSRSAPSFYDLILMDIRMPVLDGYGATGRIRSLNRPDAESVPIIALSADAFETNVQAAEKAGMNGYLAKPIDPLKLYKVIGQALQEGDSHEKQ